MYITVGPQYNVSENEAENTRRSKLVKNDASVSVMSMSLSNISTFLPDVTRQVSQNKRLFGGTVL